MEEFKESKDNPLHKKYGIGSNALYILKKCAQYDKLVIVIALVGVVCNSVQTYIWGFVGKFVIDVIQAPLAVEEKINRLVLTVLLAGIVIILIKWGSTFSAAKGWYRYINVRMRVISERVYKVLNIDYELLEKPEVLDIHERATRATDGNDNGVEGMMRTMETLATSIATIIVTFVSVSVLDFRLVILLIALAAVQYVYHLYCIKTDKKTVWDALSKTWRKQDYMQRVTEDFDFAKDIRLYQLEDFLVDKQEEVLDDITDKMDRHYNLWFRHAFWLQTLYLVANAAIYATLFWAVLNKGMTVGNFTLYLALGISFSQTLVSFLHRIGDMERESLEIDDFRSFMELDLVAKESPMDIPKASEYEIEFHNVTYRYHKAEKNSLENLNLTIKPGEKLAVVGLNGAGKTTMIKLLLRLYDPTEGYITLNGVDIRKFEKKEYYKLFAPVFQNVEVLAFPISENVSMKNKVETDLERAYNCIVEADLKARVDGLEKGIGTEMLKIVDDNGVDFSGGEKQKLALARALYKDAPVIVLDEPTSALDAIAEQRLYESFDHMIGSKSAVYISHRLASTKFCDTVAMFKDGHMIEYGTHDQLMEKNGEYANMFNIQAQYYKEEEGGENNE